MTSVLVTGASRGIGFSTAQRVAARGGTVFAGARDAGRLAERLAADESTRGLDIRAVALDVTDDDSVRAAVRQVGDTLDVLVNNAGVPGTWAPAAEVGPGDFRAVFETNLLGPVRVTQAFLPLLLASEQPRLVMVSSGMGSLTLQSTGDDYAEIAHLPYPASKAALNMLAVQYAKSLPSVIVTAIDPGLTATEFTGGSGHPVEEGSDAVVTAVFDTAGPSGRFLDREGPVSW
ncbi:SDR family NAD(P)-dependent oxidoreductase [Symbioplanes lichenis]|uniref:SDR family NAD(P)-dependent oxidoreductase n=1 Tax=Symbioplanes lichenis TaxID=1629072 RepID=UPI0027396988|nr:SDR family NAD(P)-dependent oxidoreductase [Actinoplanes lichenis]